jgi:hypothetical protein
VVVIILEMDYERDAARGPMVRLLTVDGAEWVYLSDVERECDPELARSHYKVVGEVQEALSDNVVLVRDVRTGGEYRLWTEREHQLLHTDRPAQTWPDLAPGDIVEFNTNAGEQAEYRGEQGSGAAGQ